MVLFGSLCFAFGVYVVCYYLSLEKSPPPLKQHLLLPQRRPPVRPALFGVNALDVVNHKGGPTHVHQRALRRCVGFVVDEGSFFWGHLFLFFKSKPNEHTDTQAGVRT